MSEKTLEERVKALEVALALQSQARASQDEDQADMALSLRAANHLMQTLAITQSQHTRMLERLTETVAVLVLGQAKHESRLTSHGEMLAEILRRLPEDRS